MVDATKISMSGSRASRERSILAKLRELEAGIISTEFIQFDITFADGSVEGRLQWNSEDGTLEFGLPGGNVTLQIGQEQLVKCVNKTGSTINDGEVVYISGASGSRAEISLADASDTAKDMPFGMATEDIGNNLQGYVNVHGLVRGIDTSAITAGNFGYLSEATPGAFRATAPGGTNAEVIVGTCIFSNASSGIFLVNVRDQFSQASSFGTQLFHVRDEKSSTTAGGTFTSGAWRTRALNIVKTNEITSAALSSNQISLPAGTYWIDASAPAVYCDRHTSKLRNITDGSDEIIGTPEAVNATSTRISQTRSFIRGRFTIAGTKTFEIQHRCETTRGGDGLGTVGPFSVISIYTEVMIWKVG